MKRAESGNAANAKAYKNKSFGWLVRVRGPVEWWTMTMAADTADVFFPGENPTLTCELRFLLESAASERLFCLLLYHHMFGDTIWGCCHKECPI